MGHVAPSQHPSAVAYHLGEVVTRMGGSPRHNLLSSAMGGELRATLQTAAQIEHYQREADGSWRYRRIEAGDVVTLSQGVTLAVDAVYEGAFDVAAG